MEALFGWADFQSSEGGEQGCPLMPAIYASVIKPLLKWLRTEVIRWCKEHGVHDPEEVALGAVMDDAGICAPLCTHCGRERECTSSQLDRAGDLRIVLLFSPC